MLIGYNNDVNYRGKVFHIQTEDRGKAAKQIETQIFHAGAILDTRIISYENLLEEGSPDEQKVRIKDLMKSTHKELYDNLFQGNYDAYAGLEPEDDITTNESQKTGFEPGQDRVPESALLVEEKGADAFNLRESDQIDIKALKKKLAAAKRAKKHDKKENASSETKVGNELSEQYVSEISEPDITQPQQQIPVSVMRNAQPASHINWDFSSTGTSAWKGCTVPVEDLSLTKMVEDFLG